MALFFEFAAFVTIASGFLPRQAIAAPYTADPCVNVAGKAFVPPADALACYKAFTFNETLRQNVLTNAARVFDFYTFEDYYLKSPPPFEESTINIRETIAKINTTTYATDYDFNKALYDFTTGLNDGHTRWYPYCYTVYQNILPTPLVSIDVNDGELGIYVAFDSEEFISQLPPAYGSYFDGLGFDWKRLQGARVLQIEGQDPYDYVDTIARTVSGNYLDHGIRVNSVFTSYRISGTTFSQRLGDLAGPTDVSQTSLTFKLMLVNSTVETIGVPYLASYIGAPFTDKASFWEANCAARKSTNGVDLKASSTPDGRRQPRHPKGNIIDMSHYNAIALPPQYVPSLSPVAGSGGVIKSFLLPYNKTGVMFIGSFEPADFDAFQADVASAIKDFKSKGVTNLLIDLTNNGGGYLCLGQFLHQYLAGSNFGYPGFISTLRANPLAKKIVKADIKQGLNNSLVGYTADNYATLTGKRMSASFDYFTPSLPVTINGRSDPTSQKFHDTCSSFFSQKIPSLPPFDLRKVAIVSNGNCASTCAMFSSLMYERHDTPIAVFGGKRDKYIDFKGMAGNQVLEWVDLDTEIKTAGVKNDPLAPPDLLVAGNFRHNWRTAYSYLDEKKPIAYITEPTLRFYYTKDTYNNPQNLWIFAASKLFKPE